MPKFQYPSSSTEAAAAAAAADEVSVAKAFVILLFTLGWVGVWLPVGRLVNPYPTAFPYGNGMVLHFYQQKESSTTKTVHKVINKGLKTYV